MDGEDSAFLLVDEVDAFLLTEAGVDSTFLLEGVAGSSWAFATGEGSDLLLKKRILLQIIFKTVMQI